MIRIDEIYTNTFWQYINKHIPLSRMFFCDPPGTSDPDSLFNFGHDVSELHYIYFHDQEPLHLDLHAPLLADVDRRNRDLNHGQGPVHSALVTSEWDSDSVATVCEQYNWKHFYYFFHGWASLDWYRGYDKTFLIPPADQRTITKSFICPNRIIGGKRDHRVLLIDQILKHRINNALVSCPETCPIENTSITQIAEKFNDDAIMQRLKNSDLPWHMPNENDHPMHSCWLSLFDENASSLVHVVTETVYFGKKNHLTEKTFKPICLGMPFILVSNAHSLEYLKRYGFRTFDKLWDESYDQETDDHARIEKVGALLKQLDELSTKELQQLHRHAHYIVEYNRRHFYNGSFELVLWRELQHMLKSLENEFSI
jgi:hypothetical protein